MILLSLLGKWGLGIPWTCRIDTPRSLICNTKKKEENEEKINIQQHIKWNIRGKLIDQEHTGNGSWGSGSPRKVTATNSLSLPLEVAVCSIVTVVLHRVGFIAGSFLMDSRAVSSSSTCIVYCSLKGFLTHPIFAYAVCSTCKLQPRKTKRPHQKIKRWMAILDRDMYESLQMCNIFLHPPA